MNRKKTGTILALFAAGVVLIGSVFMIIRWDTLQGAAFPPGCSVNMSTVKLYLLLLSGALLFGAFSVVNFKMKYLMIPVLILIFGTVTALLSPVGNGHDEMSHFFKTVATLDGKFFRYDSYNYEISKSYLLLYENSGLRVYDAGLREAWTNSGAFVNALDYGFAMPTYPFWGYIFPCIGVGIGRILHLSAGFTFFLGREFNVLGFALLTFTALRLLPDEVKNYGIVYALFSLMPGLVFVISHYQQDMMVYGLMMILISLYFRMRTGKKSGSCYLIFAGVFLLLIPLKTPYIFVGFLLFLLPEEFFGSKKKKYLSISVLAAAALLLAAVYSMAVNSQFTENRVAGVNGFEQLSYTLRSPFKVLAQCAVSFLSSVLFYFQHFLLLSGTAEYRISFGICVLSGTCTVLLLAKLFSCGKREFCPLPVLIQTFVILAVEFALFVSFNPVGYDGLVEGVQGRYFFSLLLLIPLVFSKECRQTDAGAKNAAIYFLFLEWVYTFASFAVFL